MGQIKSGNRDTGYIMPDNAFIEAFNGRFRAECLNAHWFLFLADAQENWRLGATTTAHQNTHLAM
ncbi:hypothetical protein GGD62_008064 [Bradyrhizobium sp. ERR14]|nr:hypothetical protein [Bradyrhizobium sp. ERR14]